LAVGKYIIAILVLCAVIMFHELGHFWLAKANGIRVNEFCIGLGPTIVGFTKGETKYSIKLLPFGGACIMEGEDEESDDSRSFQKASVWGRISVVAAGPVFNFIMAFLLSLVVIGSIGVMKPTAAAVTQGSPAQEAGIEPGDEIIKLNRKSIHFFNEISMYLFFHSDDTVKVTYLRNGEKHTVSITPAYDKASGRYLFGVSGSGVRTRLGPLKTVQYSVYNMKYWIQYTYSSLKFLVSGQASIRDMSGPVGIVKTIGDTYQQSADISLFYGIMSMLNFGILLSANLGVINLLPLPALDGGRLVFLFIEVIRGKRVRQEREAMVHFIGILCLFGFMGIIMVSDVLKLF
jgi:regulator of sigma E protease